MKITIATGPWLPVPPLRGGSVPRMWMGIAEAFANRGNEVCIVARAFDGQPEREVRRGVSYLRMGGFAQGKRIGIDLVKDFVYAILVALRLPHADILVTNSFWLPVIAAILAPAAGSIVVNANRFPKGQYKLYQRVAFIAAASHSVKSAIVRECPQLAGRTLVVPNAIDANFLRSSASIHRNAGRKTLLYVGRIHPEKGIHLLVDAFAEICAEHDDWYLRVIGPVQISEGGGGGEYLDRLKKVARGRPIEFREPIFDPASLANEYRNCDLFCYPSLAEWGEAFPVAPLEAMACGLPVVTSAIECFSEIVLIGETGWTFDHRGAGAKEALKNVLRTAMKVPGGLQAMGEKAADFAKRFSCDRVADQYLRVFVQIANEGIRNA